MNASELQSFLDEKVTQYNTRDFIDSDPVQIPHLFSLKEDIEIAGFLAATIAWGNRKMIIKNAHRMMELMGNAPYDFVLSHQEKDLKDLESFVHRTFNGQDLSKDCSIFTKTTTASKRFSRSKTQPYNIRFQNSNNCFLRSHI